MQNFIRDIKRQLALLSGLVAFVYYMYKLQLYFPDLEKWLSHTSRSDQPLLAG